MNSFYQFPSDLIDNDITKYRTDAESFKNGDIHPTKFKAFRVPCGVYEQRTENTFMVRIKSPAGGLTSHQLKTIARLSVQYGNSVPHLTTRQELQIHWVDLATPPDVMQVLKDAGLTTKGGGGNTVRNVTACYDSGVCANEPFDVAPYAIAVAEYMLPDPASYSLPRKYKIAFSGCSRDCAFATINDLGFIAKKKVVNGSEIRGFAMYAAGGMGAYSRVGDLFDEFIPAEDILYYAEGLKRFFDKNGNRKTKHKARLRFLMDKLGYDEFKKGFYTEVDRLKKEKNLNFSIRRYPSNVKPQPVPNDRAEASQAFTSWMTHNTEQQKDENYFMVTIRLRLGDIRAAQMEKLADIAERYGEGAVRIGHGQNFILRWVHQNELQSIYADLAGAGLITSNNSRIKDAVCCAGAATCKLGIGLSRGMATAIFEKLTAAGDKYNDIRDITLRISGCANSCGQHPIGQIGLHGVARRINDRMILFYKILLGGRTEEGKTSIGTEAGIVPAKNVHNLIAAFLDTCLKDRKPDENFYTYLERAGFASMKQLIETSADLPTYEDKPDFYRDWGSSNDFSLAGLGAGECGAGVFDMIDVDLKAATEQVIQAKDAEKSSKAALLFRAMVHSARALLITRGAEAGNDKEAFSLFSREFIESGIADKKYQHLIWALDEFRQENLTEKALIAKEAEIEEFTIMIAGLYSNMDDSLRFKTPEQDKQETDETGPDQTAEKGGDSGIEKIDRSMDLKGVQCPFNYVKAKIALETMETGQILELFLDDGEPINNVPGSLRNDGQAIHVTEKIDNYYRLVIEKKA